MKRNTLKRVGGPLIVAVLLMGLSFGTPTIEATSSGHSFYTQNANKRQPKKEAKRNQAPAGATAECRDGSYSYSAHRRGTCSHHGGVKRWL